MVEMGLGCVKTPTLAARVEASRRNCVPESQIVLYTRGVMPLGGTANATATATGGDAFIAGAANANSSATTINGNAAQAKSTAIGSGGQAQATAQTTFGNFQSVQSSSTSPTLITPTVTVPPTSPER
jgi:hypothetical protein